MNIKRLMLLSVLVIVVLVTFSGERTGAPVAQAQGSTIRFPLGFDPGSLDMLETGYNQNATFVVNQIYENMFRYAPDGTLLFAGAVSYEIDESGTEYTIELRPEAEWSDEQPVYAQHYVDGILRLGGTDLAYLFFPISGFEEWSAGTRDPEDVGLIAFDDYTIKMTLTEPTSHMIHIFASEWIRSPVRLDGTSDPLGPILDDYTSNGPYRLVEWVTDDYITLEKSTTYWNAASVEIENIYAPIMPDLNDQLDAYRNNQLDVSLFPGSENATILADPLLSAELRQFTRPGVYYIGLNTALSPADDVNFRRALATSIDREYLLETVLNNPWTSKATGVISPSMRGYQGTSVGHTFDRVAAADYLSLVTSNPSSITIEVWYNTSHSVIFNAVKQMWETNLGINVNLEEHEWAPYLGQLSDCQGDPFLPECDYHGYRLGWVHDYLDPWNMLNDAFHPDSYANYTHWDSGPYRNYLDLARGETDEGIRIGYFQDAERILVGDPGGVEGDVVVIPLYYYSRLVLIKSNINFEYAGTGTAPYIMNWSFKNQPTFIVNSTEDPGTPGDGELTLREAINAANANAAIDAIHFDIPGSGIRTIQPASPLPTITDPVRIDGTTQPGYSDEPIIVLDGSNWGSIGNGLHITSGNTIVSGLMINRFDGNGILLDGNGSNIINENFIGAGPTPMAPLGNNGAGVGIVNSSDNLILENVIAYNAGGGILVNDVTAPSGDTIRNSISQNSIHDNIGKGIENLNSGNTELEPPVITTMLEDSIGGTAPLNSEVVEIFADGNGEGRTFLGTANPSGGTFTFPGPLSGPNLTATATDLDGNTSEFSIPVQWAPDNCEFNDGFDYACDLATELGFSIGSEGSFQSFLSRAGDVDWYYFDLAPEADIYPGQSITIELTGVGGEDLPGNFDLAVLGELGDDPGTPASPLEGVDLQVVPLEGVPLEGVPLEGVSADSVPLEGVPLEGVVVRDIPLQETPLEGVPLEGVPLEGVPLEGVPLEGVGFHQGTQPEEVTTLFRGGMTGRYYVMVWSSTEEYSTSPTESPYKVTVTTSGVTADACVTGVDPGLAAIGPLTTPGNTTDPSTLILINRPRMEDLYGVVETGDLITSLRGLNGHRTVNGLIVDLGSDEDIMEAYNNWDNFGCSPEAANLVTIKIKHLIMNLIDTHTSIENLVLVGNDMVIPFRRVPDEVIRTPHGATVPNEFDYQNELEVAGVTIQAIGQTGTRYSPTFATMRLQYYLSDDFYADLAPILLDHGHELSVPDMPIGRLVETPQDIQAYIEGFVAREGAMGLEVGGNLSITSLTTGYSFLQDQATEILEILTDPGGKNFGAVNDPSDSLVNDAWSLIPLRDAYLPNPGSSPWIASINAHFDHSRAAPAIPTAPGPDDLFSTTHVRDATTDLRGSLIFTVGCHSGMNFVDGDVLPGYEAGMLDWPQVMISRGASLIGNWGYGYGDDAMIAYSEELMVNFARNLGVGNIGQALVDAKRQYLLNQAVLDPVHEKILMQSVLYGLPMWQLTAPVPEIPTGVDVTSTTGSQNGLDVTEYEVEVVGGQPEEVSIADRGTYYAIEGQTQAALYRPVQPQTSIDLGGASGQVAHGALFISGTYYLVEPDGDGVTDNFDPVITMPSWTRTNPEPQFIYEGWDPVKFWSLAQLDIGDGTYEERLVIVPGQFLDGEPATLPDEPTVGTERLYEDLTFEIFYALLTAEFQPPVIQQVRASVSTNPGVFFWVDVEDPPDIDEQSSGIERVLVTYTEIGGGTAWQSLDLTLNPSTGFWEGALPIIKPIDFFVQALDGSGNVGMFAGNGYFTPVEVSLGVPSTTVVGQSASFTVTEPAGLSESNYVWDFGDGTVMKGPASVDHTYSDTGEFSIQVRLVDATGNLGEAETDITVEPPASAIPDFIHYCVYANEDEIQIEERAHIMCSIGGEEGIKLEKRSEVDGNVVGRDDISIESRAYVGGDVIAAGKVILNRRANVEGEVIRGADIPPLPRVELSVSAGGSDFTVPKEQTRSLFPGTYKLLKVKEDATLVLSAGHYIFEKIEVEENATILFELAYGRQVVIDVADTVDLKEGVSMVAESGSASDIIFRVAGSDVKLGKAGTFLGTFIAPEAHIDLHEGAELTGALHGRKVQIKKKAIVHGDPALDLLWDLFTQ